MKFRLRIDRELYEALKEAGLKYSLPLSDVIARGLRWRFNRLTEGRTFEPRTVSTTDGQVVSVFCPTWAMDGEGREIRGALMEYVKENTTAPAPKQFETIAREGTDYLVKE